MTTKDAIEHLTKALKEDSGYYYSWQANIAVQFDDECRRHKINFPQLHDISNKAAINFIELLCMKEESPTPEGEKEGA